MLQGLPGSRGRTPVRSAHLRGVQPREDRHGENPAGWGGRERHKRRGERLGRSCALQETPLHAQLSNTPRKGGPGTPGKIAPSALRTKASAAEDDGLRVLSGDPAASCRAPRAVEQRGGGGSGPRGWDARGRRPGEPFLARAAGRGQGGSSRPRPTDL